MLALFFCSMDHPIAIEGILFVFRVGLCEVNLQMMWLIWVRMQLIDEAESSSFSVQWTENATRDIRGGVWIFDLFLCLLDELCSDTRDFWFCSCSVLAFAKYNWRHFGSYR